MGAVEHICRINSWVELTTAFLDDDDEEDMLFAVR